VNEVLFVLLDQTQGAKTTNGSVMTAEILGCIAGAVNCQLNRELSNEYGGNYHVRAGANSTDVQVGEIPFALLATLADAPNAIAYHTTNGNGMPLLFDGITLSDSLYDIGNSVSCAISHELCETAADPGANLWAADNIATSFSKEVCDPFENRAYPILSGGLNIYVSDFALQAYFVPRSPPPYSYMKRAKLTPYDSQAPLTVDTSLGYQMVTPFSVQGIHQAALTVHPALRAGVSIVGSCQRRPWAVAGSRRAKRSLLGVD
jgi:hypothetical protein